MPTFGRRRKADFDMTGSPKKEETANGSFRIPLTRPPGLTGDDGAVFDVLRRGAVGCYGPYTERCESLLSERYGRPVLLVSSCTHALEMSALLLRLEPGDEVVVPSFAFVTTANAFALRGARIRFVDCDEQGNLPPAQLDRVLSDRTRAVVPVHYAGGAGDVVELAGMCARVGAVLVEDAAQSIGASCADRPLGTFGVLGCVSFDFLKNVTAGQGGALIVSDPDLLERAYALRDRGTDRREFERGRVPAYQWTDIGSNWTLSEINAAYLMPQLSEVERITQRRQALWEAYRKALDAPLIEWGARALGYAAGVAPNYHLFAIVWPDAIVRDRFIRFMADAGVQVCSHYTALHASPFGRRFVGEDETFPQSESMAAGLTRLPLSLGLEPAEQETVIDATLDFLRREPCPLR